MDIHTLLCKSQSPLDPVAGINMLILLVFLLFDCSLQMCPFSNPPPPAMGLHCSESEEKGRWNLGGVGHQDDSLQGCWLSFSLII